METKEIEIKQIKRADYNPRIMPADEAATLKKSIAAWGFVSPIVVNNHPDRKGVLISGHQRLTALEALLKEGFVPPQVRKDDTGTYVPCVFVDLDLESEKTLNLAMNKISGKFDDDKLYDLILSIKDSTLLPNTGFDDRDISAILDEGAPTGKTSETHSFKTECGRCLQLKLEVLGHAKKSKHPIKFEENVKE